MEIQVWQALCKFLFMKLFTCSNCGQLLYFENCSCVRCGAFLGFLPEELELISLKQEPDSTFSRLDGDRGLRYVYCSNHQYNVCNWIVRADSHRMYCRACELNRTIPDLDDPKYLERWRTIELGKHRLIYSLLRLNLPLTSKSKDPEKGLSFYFLADENDIDASKKILTGHEDGNITLNIAEADDIEREMARRNLHELYRTVLGHFRHEIGHYYWDQLVSGTGYNKPFRRLFGDERIDYAKALEFYYKNGPALNWQEQYISGYASAHPWEDWAETWAHYLHILDTLETAYAFGLSVEPGLAASTAWHATIKADPYRVMDFESIMNLWLPLTFAMNSLNRSMGLQDPYPFVIGPAVWEKLKFIHELCSSAATSKNGTVQKELVAAN